MIQVRPFLLIVEKDEATRELYQRELSRTYSVITTEDAQQALDVLQPKEIAAVILEPATSGDAGWALISSIRDMRDRSPVRVILCSVLDERRRGMRLGAAAYLVKPVLPITLLDTLNQVLQG
jgi:DNA-binding response OmpR family regulator